LCFEAQRSVAERGRLFLAMPSARVVLTPLSLPDFDEIERFLSRRPLSPGSYLTRLFALSSLASAWSDAVLDEVFERMDDRPWLPCEQRPAGSWAAYEVSAEEARVGLVSALVGGRDFGRRDETMSAAEAQGLWWRFEGLFGAERRYYARLGLGDGDYSFQDGVAIVDGRLAGGLFIVQGD
jgi:hypothetical protein